MEYILFRSVPICEANRLIGKRIKTMETKTTEFAELGRTLISTYNPGPGWKQQLKLYYDRFEVITESLLNYVDVDIDRQSGMDGSHRYHESLLEALRDGSNPMEMLFQGNVHQSLHRLKVFRNEWEANDQGDTKTPPRTPALEDIKAMTDFVAAALNLALHWVKADSGRRYQEYNAVKRGIQLQEYGLEP